MTFSNERALFIGRFQPFHIGHLNSVKEILENHDEIIIAIAAAQYSYEPNNPFTAGERAWMIHETLKDEKIDLSRVYVLAIPDINDNLLWPHHVEKNVPPFSIVYSNNSFTLLLFEDAGFKTAKHLQFKMDLYNATRIRELIAKNSQEWKNLVPKKVVEIIERINGVRRIQEIL